MFTKEEVSLLIGKQDAFGGAIATPKFYEIPRQPNANVEHQRKKIDNPAVFKDGFKRRFALGNHTSDGTLPSVPNLEFLPVILRGLFGGMDTGATAGGLTPHEFNADHLRAREVIFHMLQVGFGDGLFYRHTDHVFKKASFKIPVEGIFTFDAASEGSGNLVKAVTSIDLAPTELIGNTIEYSTATVLEGGVDTGMITRLDFDIERKLVLKRPHNKSGKASQIRYGGTTVTGEVEIYFDSEAMYDKALDAELTQFSATLIDGTGKSALITLPEVQLEPKGPKLEGDEGIMQVFSIESVKFADDDSPINIVVTNGTATYN